MRTMYDALSTEAATIPADAELVAGYIDAGPHPAAPPWDAGTWAQFPHAIHVEIATQPGTNAGHVLDVEAGDATPDQAPRWVRMRREAGLWLPTVYCSQSEWPAVRQAFRDQAVAEPEWWIAGYPGSVGAGNLYPGSVAHQWGGNAAGTWDISAVADYWPGVDTEPAPPALPTQENANMVLIDVGGYTFLVWTAGGSVYYRSFIDGAIQRAAMVPGSRGLVDSTNPLLAKVDGLYPVVYGAAVGGKTLEITWLAKLPDGTPLAAAVVQ